MLMALRGPSSRGAKPLPRVRTPRHDLYVVAVDGSPQSARAVDVAGELANRTGAEVRVVSIEAGEGHAVRHGAPGEFRETRALLRSLETALRRFGVAASSEVVVAPSAAVGIVTYAEEVGANLVVLSSVGRSGVPRMLIGSVAMRVTELAHCPVLIVR